jgi:hypothetical protein
MLAAAAAATWAPTAVDPVNATLSTSGCPASARRAAATAASTSAASPLPR